MSLVWINGRVLDEAAARIAPADRGFLSGDGAFETLRWTGGALRRRDRHAARLASGLEALGIDPPDWDAVEAAAGELARRQGLPDAVARLTVSRGPGNPGLEAPADPSPSVVLSLRERPAPPPSVVLTVVETPRRDPTSLSARAKMIGYADNIAARRSAKAQGADMAVMLDSGGRLSCADCATLIWIENGRAYTPALSCAAMPGTARAALLEAARASRVIILEAEAPAWRIESAAAAGVLNAVTGLVPARSLGGRPLDPDDPALARLKVMETEAP